METNIELDQRILQKNLEITKLLTKIDSLTSIIVDLEAKNEQIFNAQSINIKTDEC